MNRLPVKKGFICSWILKHSKLFLLGTIHICGPWKLSNFPDPLPPVHLHQKRFLTPWPRTSSFMEQQPHRACERTKSKQKQYQVKSHSNWLRVLLFDLAHKPWNGIIKGWLHCLTPGSIGRLLVNNILMFDSTWCLVMAQIQFSLIKRWRLDVQNTRYLLHHLKVDVICASPLTLSDAKIR